MDRKNILITGAGSGIGRAVALKFANAGCAVTVAGRRRQPLEDVAAEVTNCGGDALFHPVDIADPITVNTLIEAAASRFGGVDILVNCAASATLANTRDMSADDAAAMIAVNCTGAISLVRAVWPHMRNRGGGVIVNISSAASFDPFEGLGVYGATKAFINLLTTALAAEGKPDNIQAFAVAPGAVDTPMLRGLFPDFPAAQCLTPDEVADLIVSLTKPNCGHAGGETVRIQK